MLLGGGVTVSVAVGAYFYMQSKVANNGNTNVEFANSVNQSMDQAIARIDGDRKSDDDVDKLITLAKDQYESKGDLIESKRILQSIPLDSRRRAKADQLLAQWEQDLKKNNDLTQKVDKPTKDGKWQAVIDTVKGISPTPYWQSRGKEIIEEAKQKLTIPTVPASQSVAVPPPNVDPPRNLTREIYNNPPTEIYTTPSETYTLPPDTYTPPTATYNPPPESSASPLPPAPRVAR